MKNLFNKVKNSWFGILFCAMILMLGVSGLTDAISKEILNTELGKSPVANTVIQYGSFIGIWIAFII